MKKCHEIIKLMMIKRHSVILARSSISGTSEASVSLWKKSQDSNSFKMHIGPSLPFAWSRHSAVLGFSVFPLFFSWGIYSSNYGETRGATTTDPSGIGAWLQLNGTDPASRLFYPPLIYLTLSLSISRSSPHPRPRSRDFRSVFSPSRHSSFPAVGNETPSRSFNLYGKSNAQIRAPYPGRLLVHSYQLARRKHEGIVEQRDPALRRESS